MNDNTIKILLTGDFCPMNRVERLSVKQDFASIFNDFIDVFQGNDLNIIDLECPLTLSESKRPKIGPYQKAHPDNIRILEYANIQLVAMANNHIMDYNSDGIQDTLELCNINGIHTLGIGRTPEEAAKPYSIKIKNKKLAILNFADSEFITAPDGSYTCNSIDPVQNFYDIRDASEEHDFLIVIIHAGHEYFEIPSPRTKKLYRYFIDMGADVIISHHSHEFSGYEIYKSKPIFYGLGNFIYDWPGKINSGWNKGYVVRLQISDRTDFEIIPLKQCNEKPGVFHLNKEEAEIFHNEINRLNRIIEDDDQLESEFQNYCKSVNPMYDAFIEPYFGKHITALRKRGLFPKLMSRRKRLLLLNLIRCESHRDIVMRMLKNYE